MKVPISLEIEVENLFGWLRELDRCILRHDFSIAEEIARDFIIECRRVNEIANALADEESEDE